MNKVIFLLLLFLTTTCYTREIELTIYNQDLALVKDQREFELKQGMNIIRYDDIPSGIEPSSVQFQSKTSLFGLTVKEIEYRYDLVTPERLLQKSIKKRIKIITTDSKVHEGYLISFDNNTISLLTGTETLYPISISRNAIVEIEFVEYPTEFLIKPTLILKVISGSSEVHLCELVYLTKGINWTADYVGILNATYEKLDLSCWVNIVNNSNAVYPDAWIRLIAGKPYLLLKEEKPLTQFEEILPFEYHLYTLKEKITLLENQTKQISLFHTTSIPLEKTYIYDNTKYKDKVGILLKFKNTETNGLGILLPVGKLRLYKINKEKKLEFIGEDRIIHTPINQELEVLAGYAFDIVGKRIKKEHRKVARNTYEETYQIKLTNHKSEEIKVKVLEYPHGEWEIIETTDTYNKKEANLIEFEVKIPANNEKILIYTVRYSL
jgi:hypothetical protein